MKVIYVLTNSEGGPVSHLLTLAPSVAERGIDVRVLCASDRVAGAFRDAGIAASVLEIRHKFEIGAVVRLWRELADAEIVHSHDRRAGLFARVVARARGAAVVHTEHGLPAELSAGGWRDSRPRGSVAIEALLSRLGLVVTPSHAMSKFLLAHGFSERRVRVIPNAIDLRRTEPLPPHVPLVIGTAARLEERKAIDVLIAACSGLVHPVRLEIFGDGPSRPALEAQAVRSGVQARFHGWVNDVRRRLEDVDVFVLPSRAENFPVAILEAMACALPVIATRVGGVPELVDDGKTGILCEAGDVDALRHAIAALAAEPARSTDLGRAGAGRVRRQFDPARMAERMVSVYEEARGRPS